MNKYYKILIIIGSIIVLIFTLINIKQYGEKKIISLQKSNKVLEKYQAIANPQDNENKDNNDEEDIITKLQSMSERERMEFYFSEYITYIENKEYQKAYDLLYPEFKDNYFPTLEKFEEYVKKIYPEFMTFSYNNIERQGYIYVLNIDIIDINNKDNNKNHRVVIKENDFNNYVLSFQVI